MQLIKGKTKTISFQFKKQGVFATFSNPPVWTLHSESGKRLLSGTATYNAPNWEASITIPINYVMFSEPSETLYFESFGFDNKKQSFVIQKEIELIEPTDDFLPTGVIYNLLESNPKLYDNIYLDYDNPSRIKTTLKTPFNEEIITKTIDNPSYSGVTSNGYMFELEIGTPDISYVFNDPFLLVLEIYKTLTSRPTIEVHPVYILNSRSAVLSSSLEQYLNKARITEIDKTLQFNTSDYLHYISEGMKIINAKDSPSFWTINDLPLPLQQFLFAASAWTALNARYLAEGQTNAEFSGLNANLNFNRNEVFSTKMQEMQGYLDNGLEKAKRSAISQFGYGTPPPGAVGSQRNPRNNVQLKIAGSPSTNLRGDRYGRRRRIM